MHIKYKRIIIIFITLLALYIGAEALFLAVLPRIIDINKHTDTIEEMFNEKSDASLKITDINLKTYPNFSVGLSAKKIDLKDKKQNEIFKADNTKIRVPVLPLIFKHFNLKYIKAENVVLNLERDKNGQYNIEKLIFKSEKPIFKFKTRNAKYNISNYNIYFNDLKYSKKMRLEGEYFKVSNFTMEKEIDIETYGSISAPNVKTTYQIKAYSKLPVLKNLSDSHLTLSGYIKNIEPKYFEPYIIKALNDGTNKVSGNASFDFYTQKQGKNKQIVFNGKANDIFFGNKVPEYSISAKGNTDLSATVNLKNNKINIQKFSLKGNQYSIFASGNIKDYKSKKPYLDIKVTIPYARTENLVALLPSNIIKNRNEIKRIKTYNVFADAKGDVKIKGKLPKPNITGMVKGRNVHIIKGLEGTHLGTINLRFDKRKLHSDIYIALPQSKQWVTVKGFSYLYREGSNHFDIASSNEVPLELADKLLIPIQNVFLFQLGPVPEMIIKEGKGCAKLDIKGTRESGEVKGFVRFKDVTTGYNGANAVITNGIGNVDFHGKKTIFQTPKALLEGTPVKIYGSAIMEGDLDLNIEAPNINPKLMLKIIQGSSILEEINTNLKLLKAANGNASFKINIRAKIPPTKPGEKIDIKEALNDIQTKGSLALKNTNVMVEGFTTPIKKVNGIVNFTDKKVELINISSFIGKNSQINSNGTILIDKKNKNPDANIKIQSNKVVLKEAILFGLNSTYTAKLNKNIISLMDISGVASLDFTYKIKSKNFDIKGLRGKIRFTPQPQQKSYQVQSGQIELSHGNAKIEGINARICNAPTQVSGHINNLESKNPKYRITVNTSNFDVRVIEKLITLKIFPQNLKSVLSQYNNYTGGISAYLELTNKLIKGNMALHNIRFVHKYSGVPVTISSASVRLGSNRLIAKPLNAMIGSSPLYAEMIISDIMNDPAIDGYFTTKITNDFVDTYINTKLTYPIRVKGDVSLSADLSGTLKNLAFTPTLKINEGADISYLSANLGEENGLRELKGNIFISPEVINIKKIEYIKYITSQNNRTYPMTFALIQGQAIKNAHKVFVLDSLHLKTNNYLPTRLLNFAFKKSLLKQGTFTCNLFYKNNFVTNIPQLFGTVDLKNIDIPLYDTIIRDISINSSNNTLHANVKGAAFDSDFTINTDISNKLAYPIDIKKIDLTSQRFNFDELTNTLNKMSIESYQKKQTTTLTQQNNFDIANLIIRKGHVKAGDVTFKSLPAHNLNADFSLKNAKLKLSNLDFDIASGKLTGTTIYDFKTTDMETNLVARDADSNALATAFFDMKNQIYGKMNGQLYLTTTGSNQDERLKNLNGQIFFKISDGKMPKLGSLEYLLRAGNLIKSGLTGLTINSVIDIVNPIKTGQFSSINGSFIVDNGNVKNLAIYSKGTNLSIYVKGSYDLVNQNADMKVLGKLSKKISTILGPVGNTSLNTFFNIIPQITLSDNDRAKFIKDISKIPGLDFTDNDYRVFEAKIDGNINETNYVSSFKWVQ